MKKSRSNTKRYGETILCIAGGVIGLLAVILEESVANANMIAAAGAASVDGRALGVMLASIFAICLPFFINDQHTYVGGSIVFCGVMAIVFGGTFGVLAGALIIAGGIMALSRQ